MISFSGYIHLEQIQQFNQYILFRAERSRDNLPVIIIFYKNERDAEQISKTRNQLKISRELNQTFASSVIELLVCRKQIAIVLEDKDAMPLSVILLNNSLNLNQFLNYAVNIVQNISQLHNQQIIYDDLSPSNILVNQKTGEINFIELYLKFISNKADEKTNLAQLGAVFYEMSTGHSFYQSNAEGIDLLSSNELLPPVVKRIIIKLLSSEEKEHYKTAFGAQWDLETCLKHYRNKEEIEEFKLGQKDTLQRFSIPTQLYGKDYNLSALLKTFKRASSGGAEIALVEGLAGMGKSSLVGQLLEVADQKGGFIARGKCEKEYRDTPYYSLTKAFRSLVKQILQLDEATIKEWRQKFIKNFDRNGQIVIDFIPEMELIIGTQPQVPRLAPDEAINRMNYVFEKFIHTFTDTRKPLLIFLDSFHWADSATIQLIQSVFNNINSRYIFLLLACQQNKVYYSHTLSIALDEIRHSGINIQNITVNPLNLRDISLLIEEALSFRQNFDSLAQFILDKTAGNPYFVKQIIQTLYEKKSIYFDPFGGRWEWNINDIRKLKISENVEELLADKINRLSSETKKIVKLASCIGNQFDLKLLTMAAGAEEDQIIKLLNQAIDKDLVKVLKKEEKFIDDHDEAAARDSNDDMIFQFTHSRVLQSAYSLLRREEKTKNHLLLGRLLEKNISSYQEIDQRHYKVLNQLNQAIDLIHEEEERYKLARLNLMVGRKSKAAAAVENAWKYLSQGAKLLSEDSWQKDYELTKELYLKRAECEYHIGDYKEAKSVFDLLLKNLKTSEEKAAVIQIHIDFCIKHKRYKEAVDIGLQVLKELFHQKIPPNDAELNIVSQMKIKETLALLEKKGIKNALFMPVMTDKNKKALMEIMARVLPAAYLIRKNLWIFLTIKMAQISLDYGNTDVSSFAYMNLGVVLCSGLKDYNSGQALGHLSLNLNKKFDNTELVSQLNHLFGTYINHWKDKARDNLPYLRKSFRTGIEHGNFLIAGDSIHTLLKLHIIIASPLEEVAKELKKYQDAVNQLNRKGLKYVIQIMRFALLLRETEFDSENFVKEMESFDKLLPPLKKRKGVSYLRQWYYLIKAQIHYLFYQPQKALEMIIESEKLIANNSQLIETEHYFYYSLIITENYADFNDQDRAKYWDILRRNSRLMDELAKSCPVNFSDKSKLIAAQMEGISGNFIKAGDFFDEAIKLAANNGFIQNEAIANELAAKYFLSKNKTTIASAYMSEARHAYIKWGAGAKVKHLEKLHPNLLGDRPAPASKAEADDKLKDNTVFYDLSTIIKASQEISREIMLDRMVEKLLKMALENADVQRAYFLIKQNNGLSVIAQGRAEKAPSVISCSIPLEDFDQIAQSVVFYVLRTRKTRVLDDASNDALFAYNEYIKKTKPKSILCLPVINRGNLTGIFYLENRVKTKAFSEKLARLMTILISQASISIENSMLYANLAKTTERLNLSKAQLEKRIRILEQTIAKLGNGSEVY